MILKESETLEGAREKVIKHLEALDWSFRRDLENIRSWNYILLKEAVRSFKNLISIRNEKLAGFSTLEHLWKSARNGSNGISDAFILEFTHLFKAIKGRSVVYPNKYLNGLTIPDFDEFKGRQAANVRSDYLDQLSDRMESFLKS